jgi:hypothetical protein
MEEKIIVCISCYYKGYDFMDEMKRLGNKIILVTSENLEKNWPWHAIDEVFYMPEIKPSVWNLDHLIQGFSHLMKTRKVDAVVALDDYDVEKGCINQGNFPYSGNGTRPPTVISEINWPCVRRQKIRESMFLNSLLFSMMIQWMSLWKEFLLHGS